MTIDLSILATIPPVFRGLEILKKPVSEITSEMLVTQVCVSKWRNGRNTCPSDKMEKLCSILTSTIEKYEKAVETNNVPLLDQKVDSDILKEVSAQIELAKGLLSKQLELLDLQRKEKREKLNQAKERKKAYARQKQIA